MTSTAGTKHAKSSIRKRTGNIQRQIKSARRDMNQHARGMARGARDVIAVTGSELGHLAEDGMQMAQRAVVDTVDGGRQRLEGLGEAISECVVERPMRSLLMAFGAGFIAGAFFLRPRR